ncbi:hypothetical protein SUNI508_11491 [Seiridium unicorne]|uniref:Uncharacterized protein n=1 Tax=Seiridium unicorne TaxID=138068 RepID=A0ABR2UH13_9PEZI
MDPQALVDISPQNPQISIRSKRHLGPKAADIGTNTYRLRSQNAIWGDHGAYARALDHMRKCGHEEVLHYAPEPSSPSTDSSTTGILKRWKAEQYPDTWPPTDDKLPFEAEEADNSLIVAGDSGRRRLVRFKAAHFKIIETGEEYKIPFKNEETEEESFASVQDMLVRTDFFSDIDNKCGQGKGSAYLAENASQHTVGELLDHSKTGYDTSLSSALCDDSGFLLEPASENGPSPKDT